MIHSTTSLSGIRLITSLFMFVMCSHWHNPLLQLPFASISFVIANLLQQILSLFSFICIYFLCYPHLLHQFPSLFSTLCNNFHRFCPALQQLLSLCSTFCINFPRYCPPFASISFVPSTFCNNFHRTLPPFATITFVIFHLLQPFPTFITYFCNYFLHFCPP